MRFKEWLKEDYAQPNMPATPFTPTIPQQSGNFTTDNAALRALGLKADNQQKVPFNKLLQTAAQVNPAYKSLWQSLTGAQLPSTQPNQQQPSSMRPMQQPIQPR